MLELELICLMFIESSNFMMHNTYNWLNEEIHYKRFFSLLDRRFLVRSSSIRFDLRRKLRTSRLSPDESRS